VPQQKSSDCLSEDNAAFGIIKWRSAVNNIVYIVGAVVIVLAILGFIGLR